MTSWYENRRTLKERIERIVEQSNGRITRFDQLPSELRNDVEQAAPKHIRDKGINNITAFLS